MSAFSRGVTAGFRAMLRIAGEDVVYRRGVEEYPLKLLPADQANPAEPHQALRRNWTERDWQGLLPDLDAVGLTAPQTDDEIEFETDAGTVVYAVVPGKEQCWEPVAGSLDVYQVHTVLMQNE